MNKIELGDCLEVLRGMPDNSVDSIVTDPPYGLSFMGKKWDYDVPSVEVWAECLRVLKPGGHLLAFAGTRTQHRMAVRIEDAGFEIRDMIAWVYGCLDEATEIATEHGVMPYHKTKVGDRVLCYDAAHGEYTYQPILEIVEYDYSDTAYRLIGDFGEQVVSRNHRVIVERGRGEAFQLAETIGAEARVPVLESLPALQQAVRDAESQSGGSQQDVLQDVRECFDRSGEHWCGTANGAEGANGPLRSVWRERMETRCVAAQGGVADVQSGVQRGAARSGLGEACEHGSGALVGAVGVCAQRAHDRGNKPGMEGRAHLSQSEGCVRRATDQVCALPESSAVDGADGWVRDGASADRSAGDRQGVDSNGGGTSLQSQCDGQQREQLDAVRDERGAQGVRAWGGHRAAVVRVVPFHYTGKVWCLRVPTGAFVAVRNGVAFPTGNSGFPKSMDVSKAIDKAAGAEREKVKPRSVISHQRNIGNRRPYMDDSNHMTDSDVPATAAAAAEWSGWGTALKPALEPITVARKPQDGVGIAQGMVRSKPGKGCGARRKNAR